MRKPSTSSSPKRNLVLIAVAATVICAFADGARARDDAGVLGFFAPGGGAFGARGAEPASSPPRASLPDHAGAAPAAETARPLTVRARPRRAVAVPAPSRVPSPRPPGIAAAHVRPGSKLALKEVGPRRPAVVSIFEDRTLRRGDAVMTANGIRVFGGGGKSAPYGPDDFMAVSSVKTLDGHVRKTLMEMDRVPRL